jgi:hypothetical protein
MARATTRGASLFFIGAAEKRAALPSFKIMADELFKITGLEDVQRMLDDAPRDLVARGFLKALQASADVIAEEVGVRTPIKSEDTGGLLERGELRASLRTDVQLDSQFRGGVARVGFGKAGAIANWIEWGHRLVGHKSSGKKLIGEVKARPFLRPAFDSSADAAVDAFARSLEQTVKSEFPQGDKR